MPRGSIAGSLEPQSAGRGKDNVKHSEPGTEGPAEAPEEGLHHPKAGGTARRGGRVRTLFLLAAALVVAVTATVAWVGVDALRARDELKAAAGQVQVLRSQVVKGDRPAAAATLKSLQHHAAAANAGTHCPHWSAARTLPWLGPNLRAAQTVSEVIDGLAVHALPALTGATALVDPTSLAPVKGRINLAPLVKAAPQVVSADAQVRAAASRLDAVDPDGLALAVSAPLADLRTQVGQVALTTGTAARAVRLLPAMLGANGPREYLMLVQNNAEQRATGGIPGSVVRLRAVGGAVKVVEQRSGSSLGGLPKPVLPLTSQERALFGDDLGREMLDVTFTPDFPRSAQLAQAIWREKVGGGVDGVFSIDPGALAHVLGATGPVKLLTGQQLTAKNAEQLLLNDVYRQIADPRLQDAFFAMTAGTIFDAMLGGQGKPTAVVDALAQAAR